MPQHLPSSFPTGTLPPLSFWCLSTAHPTSIPEPGPHSRATGAITRCPGGPGRPATGLGAVPWLTQQHPFLTGAAEDRRRGAPIGTSSGHYPPSVQYHPSFRSSQEPAPSLTPSLDPGPAPPLSPACSPFATVVQQEGQPRLSQVLAHQAGAFREGQAVRVLEKKPRRAAASWVQGEEAT